MDPDNDIWKLYDVQMRLAKAQVKVSNLEKKPITYLIQTSKCDIYLSTFTVTVISNNIDLAISKSNTYNEKIAKTVKCIINDHITFGYHAHYNCDGMDIKLTDVKHGY